MATPSAPEPDLKDWTWVIQDRCPDCGFDAAAFDRSELPALTRQLAGVLAEALQRPEATTRPAPDVWSPLEYGCHVRDVCRRFAARARRMLDEDDPLFENWDQNATALADRYWLQDPATVRAELVSAAEAMATTFGGVGDGQWARPGRRSNGSVFTVETLGRYFTHDLAHHAWDVTGCRW
jgi:hypothetical protein